MNIPLSATRAEYDVARNVLTFRSNVQDEVMCRISCFYVTTDT